MLALHSYHVEFRPELPGCCLVTHPYIYCFVDYKRVHCRHDGRLW